MALNVCQDCTTRFAVGLRKCPQCGSTDFQEDGAMSPKITNHGGASIAGTEVTGGQWGDDTEPDEAPAAVVEEPEDSAGPEQAEAEGEEPSPEEPELAPEPGYEEWTVEQLKEQLSERGLPKSGKRDDLVARLVEDDAARAAESRAE
jgi:RNA polymerase subunit RPABC4/transcription elongation factor Spt4